MPSSPAPAPAPTPPGTPSFRWRRRGAARSEGRADTSLRFLNALGHGAYLAHQTLWSAWARHRYARDFDRVEAFCLFIGHPRSGHSLVGAFLNAHRHAVVSHELTAPDLILAGCTRDELYGRILARASWFNLRGNRSNYVYQVPDQWQGRFEALRLIGDKRGGAVTRALAAHPDFLERVRELVRVPLRLIQVVRNPLDNIAAISIWNQRSLADTTALYFDYCATTARLGEICDPSEWIRIGHEDLVGDPRRVLAGLCRFVGLDPEPSYLDDCARVVFPSPTFTRRRVEWPAELLREVRSRARDYPHLGGYDLDPVTAGPPG